MADNETPAEGPSEDADAPCYCGGDPASGHAVECPALTPPQATGEAR